MKRLLTSLACVVVAIASCAEPPSPLAPAPRASSSAAAADAGPAPALYPIAPRGNAADDPYRPLEELDAPATRAWVDAENELTDRTLAGIPQRAALRARLATLAKVETNGLPVVRGARLFWTQDSGTQDQPTLMTAATADDPPRVLLDPAVLSPDGKLSLGGWDASEDGTKLTYGMALGGGDWHVWHVRDVATGKDLPDELAHIKYYEPQLTSDGRGLYYSRFPAPPPGRELSETDHDCKVYFHALGTPVASDRVVYERPDHPTWQFRPYLTEDGRHLVIETGDGEVGDRGQEQIVVLDTKTAGARPTVLIEGLDAEYLFVGSEGTTFYFQTNQAAPKKRIVAVDLRSPERARWKDVVPAGPEAIEGASLVGRQLLVMVVKDAHTAVAAFDLSGRKLRDVALPGLGQAYGFGGRRASTATYFKYESFTTPGTILRYDLAKGTSTPWRAPVLAFDPSAFETKQAFYPSNDGTKIPIFVTARRGLALDGTHPTLLTGYGSFGVSSLPRFVSRNVAWLERGGILALANVRGGGEYGEDWHRAAMATRKQVTWNDFIAGAEWLIRERYTSARHLGIFGGSGGGLLVGVAATQRPDLFGAVAPLRGVLDMMRFHLFGEGAGWAGDFGSPTVEAEASALRAYSPVHNVRAGTRYPALYIVTSDHDVRVAPLHSYKLAAALQAAQAGPSPILLRVAKSAGHGGATTKSSRIDNDAELLAFFTRYLD